MDEIETITCEEVAKALNTTHRKIILMMKNGTLPIGAVAEPENDKEHYVCKIIKTRFLKWINGEL